VEATPTIGSLSVFANNAYQVFTGSPGKVLQERTSRRLGTDGSKFAYASHLLSALRWDTVLYIAAWSNTDLGQFLIADLDVAGAAYGSGHGRWRVMAMGNAGAFAALENDLFQVQNAIGRAMDNVAGLDNPSLKLRSDLLELVPALKTVPVKDLIDEGFKDSAGQPSTTILNKVQTLWKEKYSIDAQAKRISATGAAVNMSAITAAISAKSWSVPARRTRSTKLTANTLATEMWRDSGCAAMPKYEARRPQGKEMTLRGDDPAGAFEPGFDHGEPLVFRMAVYPNCATVVSIFFENGAPADGSAKFEKGVVSGQDPGGQTIAQVKDAIARVAALVNSGMAASVEVEGYASLAGEGSATVNNAELSGRRADLVIAQLIEAGVPAGKISKASFGSSQATIIPLSRQIADRRVDIRLYDGL
jgi:hypothetical protein